MTKAEYCGSSAAQMPHAHCQTCCVINAVMIAALLLQRKSFRCKGSKAGWYWNELAHEHVKTVVEQLSTPDAAYPTAILHKM